MLKFIGSSLAVLVLCGAGPRETRPVGPAEVLQFSNPLQITNAFAVFDPDTMSVHHGRDEGRSTIDVMLQLEEIRIFDVGQQRVETRVLEHREFVGGVLVEVTKTYLAQDDAGNVRAFGEVSVNYADGSPIGVEQDSWLVGGAGPADELGPINVSETPVMYMPAEPKLGDVFFLENHEGGSEQIKVVAVGLKVTTPAGNFSQAILIEESHPGQQPGGGGEGGAAEEPERPEYRWLVPGVGMVKELSGNHRSVLIALSAPAVEFEGAQAPPR